MAIIYLVSCVSIKQENEAQAEDLYVSDWFKKAKAYAKSNTDSWFILSAKYGLVHPSEVIQPYELTLNKMLKAERTKWSQTVLEELLTKTSPGDHLVFLAGSHYREFLIPALSKAGYTTEVPLANMGIGEQLRWLKNNRDYIN